MGALITGIAYFCLGIQLTLLMVFKYEAGITGIWCGPILATAFNTVMYITMFTKIDLDSLIKDSKQKREADKMLQAKQNEEDGFK